MRRTTAGLFCAAVVLTGVGLASLRSATPLKRDSTPAVPVDPAVSTEVVQADGRGPVVTVLDSDVPWYEQLQTAGETVATALRTDEPATAETAATPGRLPSAAHAAPIDGSVRALIDEELPGVSSEERDVWAGELDGMPLDMARDVLRMRRKLGSMNLSRPARLPEFITPPSSLTSSRAPRVAARPDLPNGSGGISAERLAAVRAPLQLAQAIVLNNLANAETPGFKRQHVLLAEPPRSTASQSEPSAASVDAGVAVAATLLDLAPGTMRRTNRPLDVAIAGEGFFQLHDGERIVYTRAGRWIGNAEGHLASAGAGTIRLVEPPIVLPQGATGSVRIDADGTVSVRSQRGEETIVGKLQLARFANPEFLEPQGECLFRATDAAGTSVVGEPGTPGFGRLKQHVFESSNVDVERELAELRRLTRLLQALDRTAELPPAEPEHDPPLNRTHPEP